MKTDPGKPTSIDEYIAGFPADVQVVLKRFRRAIREAAPDAEEVISYQIPTYKQNGMLVHFAAWKNHIGFYPGSSGVRAFKKELSKYENAKGSVQFPLDQPMPLNLIKTMVAFRVRENMKKVVMVSTKKIK